MITLEDVNQVIGIMSSPSQYSDADESTEEPKQKKENRNVPVASTVTRKMQFSGGVAAGLSAYTGLDVTLIRIILVVLLFL